MISKLSFEIAPFFSSRSTAFPILRCFYYSTPKNHAKEEYLDIIAHELSKKGIALSREELRVEAVRWEMEHSGRNGRIAHQFVTWYVGQCFLKKDKSI